MCQPQSLMRGPIPVEPKTSESISVVFPVYNDARSIGEMVSDVRDVLERRFHDWEIILVNDGSEDDSAEVVERLAASDRRICVVHHRGNQGYGAAINTGFAHSTGELVFYTDSDGQFDPRELERLLAHIDGTDLVTGVKRRRSDAWIRRIEGSFYHAVTRFIFELSVRDVDCNFRLLRRHVVDKIMPLWCREGAVGAEMLAKAKAWRCRVAQVPVNHFPRRYGRSQFFCFKHISRSILEIFELWCLLMAAKRKKTLRRAIGPFSCGAPGEAPIGSLHKNV